MKVKLIIGLCLLLSIGLLSAEDLYGAFRVKTKPKSADINLYDIDEYLCSTPSPVYPVFMDEYLEYREGIPGRTITLMITKDGYIPLKKEIFVPVLFTEITTALDYPAEFTFNLKPDHSHTYINICLYYTFGYHYRRQHNHHYTGAHWNPWYHPGSWCYNDPPHHPGGGHNPPPPPPGGGGHNPPPPPPDGGGGHNPPPPGGSGYNPPIGGGSGLTTAPKPIEPPPTAEKPVIKSKDVTYFPPSIGNKPPILKDKVEATLKKQKPSPNITKEKSGASDKARSAISPNVKNKPDPTKEEKLSKQDKKS